MPHKQIFYDPDRKRWKRLRRIFDITAVVFTLVLAAFIFNILRNQNLPELLLPSPQHNYKALRDRNAESRAIHAAHATHRKSTRKPSEIPLNSDEGLRAAFYVPYDPTSYSSFKEHVHQIDLLFPAWLHMNGAEGVLRGSTLDGHDYPIFDRNSAHDPDELNKIKHVIQTEKVDTEIFPVLSNFSTLKQNFDPAYGDWLKDPSNRQSLIEQLQHFFSTFPAYRGLSLDVENLNDDADQSYLQLIQELYPVLHARNLRLYINTAALTEDADLKLLAANSDGIILMNYDEHEVDSKPGPIASQTWFVNNLTRALKAIPRGKLICAVGNYAYDWTLTVPDPKDRKHPKPHVLNTSDLSVSDAWQHASDADADLDLDYDSLNPHFEYIDEDRHERHIVWFLDGVTILNEMRAARELGIQTFALWRLGEEDSSLWNVWDRPRNPDALTSLGNVLPGHDVDNEGDGDILRVTGTPQPGKRTVWVDEDETNPQRKLIIDEHMDVYPRGYIVSQYGYDPHRVALSFDDGPDPTWTPKILDVLNKKGVKGTFFMIGNSADENVGLMQRVYNDGHEIGNHTFTHPDISEISPQQLSIEIKLTERLFASKLGVQPLYFRPPYSVDQEPDTDDQADPVERIEKQGYIIIGDKIDTDDWDERSHKSPQEITDTVLDTLRNMNNPNKPWTRGSIILLHDGGGDRSATVAALPYLIDSLRAHGYQIVPVSALMGKTRDQVMPKMTWLQYIRALPDSIAFTVIAFLGKFIVMVFFLGDILMSARLLLVGLFAIIERIRGNPARANGNFKPNVAVLVPAYNEEKVIVRTIRSVLNSDYPNLRVIVIDDGSTDATFQVARDAYKNEIATGRVLVLTHPNGGKAMALNFALQYVTEEFYVGIDADTVIANDAVSKLIPHFADPKIGAIAGNAKVGNRVNLWTRWQALEYITSQNFERRALDLFHVVTVVPGAIGAWRTAPVKEVGGYPINTVAEDADLTMNLLEHSYEVIYEDHSLAFTEAPIDAKGLMRQRFRWSFGILQAVWKHRAAFTKNKAMGFFALPNILIFQMLLPLVSPFIDIMFIAGVIKYFVDLHYHPAAASAASFQKLLVYFLTFLMIDFITSTIAFSLERRHPANKGDGWLLFHIWLQRFAYRQLFSIVLFKTVKRAIDGKPFNWDKLERTAKMSKATDALTEKA
jgi:cellulose synthase/poly-beta-1,6-N-acetylglucosamine synthase-like glycosyltransferase/peptidoglycan/xylan/chitin deacetylase (PgdA/CDA1 family)/spore germination protein YaaH